LREAIADFRARFSGQDAGAGDFCFRNKGLWDDEAVNARKMVSSMGERT